MKILVIGGTGMLGSSIILTKTSHNIWGTYLQMVPNSKNFLELDITDKNQVKKVVERINPDVIINTAAITDVDLCEKKPELAKAVHVIGTENLVNISREKGIYFQYISTDSVFDGKKGNYSEEDKTNPLNTYAKTKYDGELITLNYQNSSVIRVNIYGYNWLPKKSFTEWILDCLCKKEKIRLFKDVYFSPILVNNLAEVLLEIIALNLKGVYHVAGPEGISKLEFGKLIADIYKLKKDLIKPISISELDLKAPRPLNPTLNCSKIQNLIKTTLLNVREGLELFKKLKDIGYLRDLKNL